MLHGSFQNGDVCKSLCSWSYSTPSIKIHANVIKFTVWKKQKITLTWKIFLEMNLQHGSLVKTSFTQNFCCKVVRVKLRNFYTVTANNKALNKLLNLLLLDRVSVVFSKSRHHTILSSATCFVLSESLSNTQTFTCLFDAVKRDLVGADDADLTVSKLRNFTLTLS